MMPNWDADAAAGKLILERAGLEVFHSPLHLEGGSIHTDGEGCVRHLKPYTLPACLPAAMWLSGDSLTPLPFSVTHIVGDAVLMLPVDSVEEQDLRNKSFLA